MKSESEALVWYGKLKFALDAYNLKEGLKLLSEFDVIVQNSEDKIKELKALKQDFDFQNYSEDNIIDARMSKWTASTHFYYHQLVNNRKILDIYYEFAIQSMSKDTEDRSDKKLRLFLDTLCPGLFVTTIITVAVFWPVGIAAGFIFIGFAIAKWKMSQSLKDGEIAKKAEHVKRIVLQVKILEHMISQYERGIDPRNGQKLLGFKENFLKQCYEELIGLGSELKNYKVDHTKSNQLEKGIWQDSIKAAAKAMAFAFCFSGALLGLVTIPAVKSVAVAAFILLASNPVTAIVAGIILGAVALYGLYRVGKVLCKSYHSSRNTLIADRVKRYSQYKKAEKKLEKVTQRAEQVNRNLQPSQSKQTKGNVVRLFKSHLNASAGSKKSNSQKLKDRQIGIQKQI